MQETSFNYRNEMQQVVKRKESLVAVGEAGTFVQNINNVFFFSLYYNYVFKTVAITFITSLPTTRGSMSCNALIVILLGYSHRGRSL